MKMMVLSSNQVASLAAAEWTATEWGVVIGLLTLGATLVGVAIAWRSFRSSSDSDTDRELQLDEVARRVETLEHLADEQSRAQVGTNKKLARVENLVDRIDARGRRLESRVQPHLKLHVSACEGKGSMNLLGRNEGVHPVSIIGFEVLYTDGTADTPALSFGHSVLLVPQAQSWEDDGDGYEYVASLEAAPLMEMSSQGVEVRGFRLRLVGEEDPFVWTPAGLRDEVVKKALKSMFRP